VVAQRAATLLLVVALLTGCGARHAPAAAAEPGATQQSVRAFMQAIAADVTREGPAAWRREFAGGPEFFMASDGQLVFPDGAAAVRGIEALTHTLAKIELSFGDDLRVDVLTPTLAVVGCSYRELQSDAQGHERTDRGYFTGLAELKDGHWRLRNAHWSSRP
jgi:hypothetical protein